MNKIGTLDLSSGYYSFQHVPKLYTLMSRVSTLVSEHEAVQNRIDDELTLRMMMLILLNIMNCYLNILSF